MSDVHSMVAAALARGMVLGVLDEPALQRLVGAGSPVELMLGGVLFEAGDIGDAAYVVISGEVELRTQAPDGREVRIASLAAGAVLGEMSVIDGAARSATAVGQRRTRLWRIPTAALVAALEADPRAALALLAELSRRLRAANAALESRRLLSLGGRLAQLLTAEHALHGPITLTQTEIARRLGHSREKVNRKLNQWVRGGWILIDRTGIKVLDLRQLQAQAALR
jgi:CRP/FNR family cyclic AMP-dependent transcriptional regulator